MNNKFVIRKTTLEDAEALTELALISKAAWGYPKEWLETWHDDLKVTVKELEEWVGYVAEEQGKIIGFWAREAKQTEQITNGRLFVHPDYFGQGIAKLLWQNLQQALIKRGIHSFVLEADPNAAPFYQKMGGVVVRYNQSSTIKDRKLPIIQFDLSSR